MYSILVVDEDSIFREVFVEFLSELFPWTAVVVAETGAKAVERINSNPTNLVFTNIRLCDCSGLQLTSKIKNMHPEIGCVILSLFDFSEYIDAATVNHADYFVCHAAVNMNGIAEFIKSRCPGIDSTELGVEEVRGSSLKKLGT